MITSNILLGENVFIEKSSSVNNVKIGKDCRIASNVNIFGSADHLLEIGDSCYIGPGCILEGFNAKVKIGSNVSFAQNINLMSGSGPNGSKRLQNLFPLQKGEVSIGDHSWIGAGVIIMPYVTLGKFCIVAANSFVNKSFEDYSIIGGNPAKLIRMLTAEEILKL
jgi:acetyltransferase-like isoleucine patch superfamily enzyme